MKKITKEIACVISIIVVFGLGFYIGTEATSATPEQPSNSLQTQLNSLQWELSVTKSTLDASLKDLTSAKEANVSITKELAAKRASESENLELRKTITRMVASRGTTPVRNFEPKEVKPLSNYEFLSYAGEFKISYYTPSADECGNDKGITSSGAVLAPGFTVAVDSKYWKPGTMFYIEGFGIVMAQDTGGWIKGKNRMDVAVLDKTKAINLGREVRRVWVVNER